MLNDKKKFIEIISLYYPLKKNHLTLFQKVLYWNCISNNSNILWEENSYFEHVDKLDLYKVSFFSRLPWSKNFIDQIIQKKLMTWEDLCHSRSLFENPEMFTYGLKYFMQQKIGSFPKFKFGGIFGKEIPEKYDSAVERISHFDWDKLSRLDSYP
ncbi:MAG: hypothetical protein CL678_07505 [Bdellovibrionaceae bacterium]|nr:hypothetical protein [Pseudobdellovibrionaceae bacterium]